jgi:hypothetical protein
MYNPPRLDSLCGLAETLKANSHTATCGEPAISLHFHHVSLVQWTTRLLRVTRNPGSKPLGGNLCKTGNLLLALSRYIGDPDVIDHCGLV